MCHRIVDGHANTLTHAIHYLPFVDFYFIWAHFEKAPARSRLKRNGALFSCAFILENWMGNGLSQTSTTVLSISNYPHILEKSFFFCSSWWIGLMCDLLFWSAVRFIRNSMIVPSHFLVVVDFLSTSHCSIFYVIVPVVWAISALAVCLAHINSKIADRICPVYVITIRVSKHTYIRWSMPLQFSGLMAHISTNIYRPLSWLPMTITFHSLLYDFTIHYLYS